MSAAHLHLALNHIPVLGTLLGATVLAYGLGRGYEAVQRVGLVLLVVAGGGALAVYWTGGAAEEVVEGLAGVSHEAIEAHEAWGWYALLTGIGSGGAAFVALIVRSMGRRVTPWGHVVVLGLALLSSGAMMYTANLGGQVHHPELRASPPSGPDANEPEEPEAEATVPDGAERDEHE
jgi:hypothetical protein